MSEPAITPEVLEAEEVIKAVALQRTQLQQLPGAQQIFAAFDSWLNQAEDLAKIGMRGHKTFLLTAGVVLKKDLDEDSYKTCRALAVEAENHEKQTIQAFELSTNFFFRFHRALTSIRSSGAEPWTKIKDALNAHAKKWWLKQQDEKRKAEQRLSTMADQEKRKLEQEAQDLIAMGYLSKAKELLSQADVVSAPISLPPPPKVAGARDTEKWAITVTDILAVVKAVAEGRFPLMHQVQPRGSKEMEELPLLEVNMKVLRALVDRQGDGITKKIPGISVKPDVSFSGNRKEVG